LVIEGLCRADLGVHITEFRQLLELLEESIPLPLRIFRFLVIGREESYLLIGAEFVDGFSVIPRAAQHDGRKPIRNYSLILRREAVFHDHLDPSRHPRRDRPGRIRLRNDRLGEHRHLLPLGGAEKGQVGGIESLTYSRESAFWKSNTAPHSHGHDF